jgi:glyoxylase-like metal-dependent hydrolase (beta-lactamase superfamily II)
MLDTGWHIGEREGIDELLEKNNFKVVGIICSHAHRDHVGNNAYLKKKYNSIIAMPAYEAEACSSIDRLNTYYGTLTLPEVEKHLGEMVCETDINISENEDKINMCGYEFRVLHTPGHSAAHICIVTPDDVAYLGDALISDEVIRVSKMPYVFILREDLESKAKLYDLKCSRYVVAHKGMYDDITKLITDNIDFYKSMPDKIYNILEGAMSIDDVIKAASSKLNIYIRSPFRYALMNRVLKSNLNYLIEDERIETTEEDGLLKYKKVASKA